MIILFILNVTFKSHEKKKEKKTRKFLYSKVRLSYVVNISFWTVSIILYTF